MLGLAITRMLHVTPCSCTQHDACMQCLRVWVIKHIHNTHTTAAEPAANRSWALNPLCWGAKALLQPCHSLLQPHASSAASLGDAATACYSLQRNDRPSHWRGRLHCCCCCWGVGLRGWDLEFCLLLLPLLLPLLDLPLLCCLASDPCVLQCCHPLCPAFCTQSPQFLLPILYCGHQRVTPLGPLSLGAASSSSLAVFAAAALAAAGDGGDGDGEGVSCVTASLGTFGPCVLTQTPDLCG
jgi:hypothetical protein